MIPTPVHTTEDFAAAKLVAIDTFRDGRLEEPLEDYNDAFDRSQGITEEVLEATIDLSNIEDSAIDLLADKERLLVLRYLAGPPISLDDLKTLSDTKSLSRKSLEQNPEAVKRLIEIIQIALDRKRFPWVIEQREPTEIERHAAVLASATLIATQHVGTGRRTESKVAQEAAVEAALIVMGWKKVPTRPINTLSDAPKPGEFCRETLLGTRKADFVIGLMDGRILALECKVSNSSTNSVKRLNNDAAAKAVSWIKQFGTSGVVPAAVLSGVYNLKNLEAAQSAGLTIFWAHDLKVLTDWIQQAK